MAISYDDYYSTPEIPILIKMLWREIVPVHFHQTFFLKNTSKNRQEFSKYSQISA